MKAASSFLMALAYLGAISFGVRFYLTQEYMPYHAQAAGKSWNEVDPRLKPVFIVLMRVLAGGTLGVGLAGLWMTFLWYQGLPLPVLLVALPGLVLGLVSLQAVFLLKAAGGRDAPLAQIGGLVAMAVVALVLGFLSA